MNLPPWYPNLSINLDRWFSCQRWSIAWSTCSRWRRRMLQWSARRLEMGGRIEEPSTPENQVVITKSPLNHHWSILFCWLLTCVDWFDWLACLACVQYFPMVYGNCVRNNLSNFAWNNQLCHGKPWSGHRSLATLCFEAGSCESMSAQHFQITCVLFLSHFYNGSAHCWSGWGPANMLARLIIFRLFRTVFRSRSLGHWEGMGRPW